MDVQLRGYIKRTRVALVHPKEGDPFIEGTLTTTFPVDDSADVATLADIQQAGQIVAGVKSVQLSMPGIRGAAAR
ncbi:MAG: hypothetical protein KGK07_15710 [Chloroflexota bacterium]|nr:hypothetical protein [Chloroflexota bacterium]